MFPFLVMTIISKHYKQFDDTEFQQKYASVIEGLQHPHAEFNAMRAYYYPAFLMQRVLFTGTLIIFYSWPLPQCILISASNILVTLLSLIK